MSRVKLTIWKSTIPPALPLTNAKADSTLSLVNGFEPQMSCAA
jgi:hypothetical protein